MAKKASLKRIEAGLLLELGQREQAIAAAASLAGPDSCPASASAFLADILARACRWRRSEEEFGRARLLAEREGNLEKAVKLAAGPLFLLAEARGDHALCEETAPFGMLANRARRLLGHPLQHCAEIMPDSPWREVALLEEAHLGLSPGVLDGVLDLWKAGEAEWRWRILYEGAVLWAEHGLPMKQWRRYLAATGGTVLDPRFPAERKHLKKLF